MTIPGMRHRGEKDAACAVDLAWEDKLAVHRLAEEFEEKMAALEAVMSEHAAERAELEAYWHQALRAGMVGAVSHRPTLLSCCYRYLQADDGYMFTRRTHHWLGGYLER